jgi:predicted CXXCH cytochrome family protein
MKAGLNTVALFFAILGGSLIVLPGQVAIADGLNFNGSAVLAGILPDIPKGKGEACIAPTDFMRRNHMNLLTHDRDETVYFGNRQIKASLKGCVSCHAVNGADNTPITVEDPKHFCRTCHDYVAVKIDCFECHASRPEPNLKSKLDKVTKENQDLAAYAKGSK